MSQRDATGSLAGCLRDLRTRQAGARVTQQALAKVLGVSVASISSWESGGALPPLERLQDYALAFASPRTFHGAVPVLLKEAELTAAEERRRQTLLEEFVRHRDRELRSPGQGATDPGTLRGRFWHFPDGAPIRIITTPSWPPLSETIPYLDPWHPNYIQSFRDMDRDATIELFGHLRAENPSSDVRFLTADEVTRDDLTAHVVILGQGDKMPSSGEIQLDGSELSLSRPIEWFISRLEFPIEARLPKDGDPEFDSEFVVTLDVEGMPKWFVDPNDAPKTEVYRPRFLRAGGVVQKVNGLPILEYDVAFLARKPNPLNLATSVTICSGVFSRGTYGAVRALTDNRLRDRNERFLITRFDSLDAFWILFHVPIFRTSRGLDTVTPDLERPFHRLMDSTGGDEGND